MQVFGVGGIFRGNLKEKQDRPRTMIQLSQRKRLVIPGYKKTVQGTVSPLILSYTVRYSLTYFKHAKFRQDPHVLERTMLCYNVGVGGKREEKIR